MTANGDGLNFDFLDEPEPSQKPTVPTVPSPLGIPPVKAMEPGELLSDSAVESKASIFDDEPGEPAQTLDEIPDAIPNISDGGTEILVRGRTERKDFSEEFGTDPPDQAGVDPAPPEAAPVSETPPAPESWRTFESLSALVEPIESLIDQAPTHALQNPLGGQFYDSFADPAEDTPVGIETCADTVVGDSPFRDQPMLDGEPATNTELDDTPVISESGDMSLDILNDSGMSLSSMASVAGAAAASTIPKAIAAPTSGNQRVMLIAIGGYAIIVTALCVLLLGMLTKARNAGQLESLPDLKSIPPGKVAIYPVNSQMPAGHTLALGESQRFGNLRVEPIKVTRGPIQFQYYKPDADQKGYASGPVLKLWLKFTNESSSQAFVPLDGDLLFKRRVDASDAVRANQFLVQKQDKARNSPSAFLYDHQPESSNYDMAGQRLGQQLQPGESIETYIPTSEEGIDRLKGDLLWRVHLRKGHSPSGSGVTTLVEVAFTPEQIQSEGT